MITFKQYINEQVAVNVPRVLFHAAPSKYKQDILKQGLKPSKGGTTFLNRTYSARVHLCTRIEAAWDFTMSINARREQGEDEIEYDIFHINVEELPENTEFYTDPAFDHFGVWTEGVIPATSIVKVTKVDHDWEPDDDYYAGKNE